jgi:dihydrofolate reductase
MARLIVEEIVSADGTAADADGGMAFVPESVDEGDVDTEQVQRFRDLSAIVLGTTTYRMFVDYWPTQTPEQEPISQLINSLPKHVVSHSLDAAPWGEHEAAIVERGDGVEVVRRLKRSYDGEIVLWGSLTLAAAAFAGGEVDVLRLRVLPTLIGGGRGVVPPTLPVTSLRLVSVHAHGGGQVALEYDVQR